MNRLNLIPRSDNVMVLVMLPTMFMMICNASTVNETSNNTNVIPQTFTNPELSMCDKSPSYMSANRNECCALYYNSFAGSWYLGGYYLTTYLTTLKNWKCDEYYSECENPVYDFTPFTKLVYQSFCDRKRLFNSCIETLHNLSPKNVSYANNSQMASGAKLWSSLTSSLIPREMSMESLNEPCVQIALFDRPSGGVGRFHELCEPFTLFGDITWVGYDMDTAMERDISPWNTYSSSLKASLIVCVIVNTILSVAVVAANMIVLAVYTTTPKLRNSQAIYKINVALSDFMSGLTIIPSTIIFGYLRFCVPRKMEDIVPTSSNVTYRLEGGGSRSVIPTNYIYAMGFFTTFTLAVSLYTLLIASCDRLFAILRPLGYNKANAKKHAQIACCIVWIVTFLISTIPYMIDDLVYNLTAGLLVTSVGDAASILLAVAFGLPLILVCVTNIVMFRAAQQHAKVRATLRTSTMRKGVNRGRPTNIDDIEKRLSKVLGLMVGVFVACVLPVFTTTLSAAAIDNIVFYLPEQLDLTAVKIYHSVGYCFGIVLLSNSMWNCLIYSVRGPEFRTAVRSLRAIKIAGSTVNSAFSSIRRLSAVTVVHYRRKSSGSVYDINSSSGAMIRRTTLNSQKSTPSQDIGPEATPNKEYYPLSNKLETQPSVSRSVSETHRATE